MNKKEQKYRFVKWTSNMSPNSIDWIRSIYFSLFGSSMLTFCLKLSILSKDALSIFAIGVSAFLVGLWVSVKIASRFKRYERNYDSKSETEKLAKDTPDFYYEQETDKEPVLLNRIRTEHFFFYTVWIPAVICIGYAGFCMESQSSKNSSETKKGLQGIETRIQQLDSVFQTINDNGKEKKIFQDSLLVGMKVIDMQMNQIDSLRKVIDTLGEEPKSKEKKLSK
jgi:hypothetical protein